MITIIRFQTIECKACDASGKAAKLGGSQTLEGDTKIVCFVLQDICTACEGKGYQTVILKTTVYNRFRIEKAKKNKNKGA